MIWVLSPHEHFCRMKAIQLCSISQRCSTQTSFCMNFTKDSAATVMIEMQQMEAMEAMDGMKSALDILASSKENSYFLISLPSPFGNYICNSGSPFSD